ncbi:MAG: anti-sigma factor [Hydrogenophaga sp.]|uniref:anti-sigma factor n=1 Tax=Hydrogenophaga sp. TaxID=1904254 RepID=UPI001D2C9229|nr:anti-sigma factor [Hydrogenophaga sp.]MBX3609327.1 anti-sigma factor [Hydrogenophaga sp.]
MTPDARDRDDALASAYVLGTLSAARRTEVQQRLITDAELRARVQAWEERLMPLTALTEPVAPSPAVWARIDASIGPSPVATARRARSVTQRGWQDWWRSLWFWRAVAVTGFATASLVALVPVTGLFAPAEPQYMVVLVAPNSTAPGWVVRTSGPHSLRLEPLGTTNLPAQRSLQFWTKADTWDAPVSLGLVQPGQALEVPIDRLPPLVPNQLFEITLEPYNGSPTGRPTGPVLYIGRSVRLG